MKHLILSLSFAFILFSLAAQNVSGNNALIVLDMQEQFTRHAIDSLCSASLIEAVNEAITECRPQEVIFVTADLKVLSVSLRGIKAEPAEHLDLDGRLYRKKNDQVFNKGKSSAFSVPELNEFLASKNIKHVYLVGLYLGECISGTAIDGVSKGYEISVIEDAVRAKRSSKTEKYFADLRKNNVQTISLKEFVAKKNR